jgi:hypothetical protein
MAPSTGHLGLLHDDSSRAGGARQLIPPNSRRACVGLGVAAMLAVAAPVLMSFLLWSGNPLDTLQGRYVL